MLKKGDQAPGFELADDSGATTTLSELLEEGPIILYFYPKDFTSVCTRQACMVRDTHERIEAAGLRVIGINSEASEKHGRFREHHRLPFRLLVDPGREVARAYEAVGPFGLYTARVSYLIGEDGIVRGSVRSDLRLAPHKRLIERALAKRKID
jgi:peroxiredoxin Q/BCP